MHTKLPIESKLQKYSTLSAQHNKNIYIYKVEKNNKITVNVHPLKAATERLN